MSGRDKTDDPCYVGEDNFPAPYLVAGPEPSVDEKINICVIERVMEEFWFKGEVEKAPEFFSEDGWRYDPFVPDLKGPEAYAMLVRKYHKAFEFEEFDLQIVMADGDWISWRTKTKAKHVGEFEGIPATGADMSIITHTFVRFNEEHKAQEGWILTDYMHMFIAMFFALNWFQRVWYLPRFYKTLKKLKNYIDTPPTNPTGGKRHVSVAAT